MASNHGLNFSQFDNLQQSQPLIPNPKSLIPLIKAYKNRDVVFQFRQRSYTFSLSLGLFSSAGIDTGSRFLLKVFSSYLDECLASPSSWRLPDAGEASPYSVLDAGSGVGVLGICAAGALSALPELKAGALPGRFYMRAQDRDCLARVFTAYNAEKNGIPQDVLEAHTEPLLSGESGQGWDLILSNIPAKAGQPVLEDFVRRSTALLKSKGRVFLVAVNTLTDFFRSQIAAAGAPLILEESGKEHTVFVYGPSGASGSQTEAAATANDEFGPVIFDKDFTENYPFYIRNRNEYTIEENSFHLDTVYGAPDFDSPSEAALAAAKLAKKIDLKTKLSALFNTANNRNLSPSLQTEVEEKNFLVFGGGQGHFALWLASYLEEITIRWTLSDRNLLGLAAAQKGLVSARGDRCVTPPIIPATDIFLDRERLAPNKNKFALIAFFPDFVPPNKKSGINREEMAWEGFSHLAGGIVIAGMASAESERFDRKKPSSFTRLGEIRRKGFRALAYHV